MEKQNVVLNKNIDVLVLRDGSKGTVKDYIDIKITDGVGIRVCLIEDVKTKKQFLYLENQLVAAFEKHEESVINSYYINWFYNDDLKGFEDNVIGDGNLMQKIWRIQNEISKKEDVVNRVMINIQRKMGIKY